MPMKKILLIIPPAAMLLPSCDISIPLGGGDAGTDTFIVPSDFHGVWRGESGDLTISAERICGDVGGEMIDTESLIEDGATIYHEESGRNAYALVFSPGSGIYSLLLSIEDDGSLSIAVDYGGGRIAYGLYRRI